ncbi:MAG TPA: hypothetical protein VE398_06560, partial [Acidobacteriota bacterium]|nr:hypothetical protein [Acidobacteriota bacterium]
MNWKRLNLLPFIVFILTLDSATAQERLSKGPIIQNVQTNRATINWVTTRTVGELQKLGSATATPVGEQVTHQVELTGLEPGTAY